MDPHPEPNRHYVALKEWTVVHEQYLVELRRALIMDKAAANLG